MKPILGRLIGFLLCGLIPAIVVLWAFSALGINASKQAKWGLPGGGHGFGDAFVALCVLGLGGSVGAILGARLASRFGTRVEREADRRDESSEAERRDAPNGPEQLKRPRGRPRKAR